MEQNGSSNENMPSTMLCTRGCGFYGSQCYDGMCSKCYKDMVKRRQHNPSPNANLLSGAPSSLASTEQRDIVAAFSASSLHVADASTAADKDQEKSDDCKQTLSLENISINSPTSESSAPTVEQATASVETGSPTVPSVAAAIAKSSEDNNTSLDSSASSVTEDSKSPADQERKPKKNRCHACKKKVGLTGFECRCGGLYCGLHRYSDKHDCTFDYKELAQEEIRKANPVIVGAKVQKI